MITHYDMASGEPIVDRMEDHESEPVAAPAQPQARLMTVEEANANERSVHRDMPADMLTMNLGAFLDSQA